MAHCDFASVLDIGSGPQPGGHAEVFRQSYKRVTTVDLDASADYCGEFPHVGPRNREFDLVWCSHVLEHTRNVGQFLYAAMRATTEDGWLAITVPANHNQRLLGGHLNDFSAGRLLYNMIVNGIDCSRAAVRTWGWECAVIVQPREIVGMPRLKMDNGDLELLAPYFPQPVHQGMGSDWDAIHWEGVPHAARS